jgi:hypothetical protein
MENVTTESKRGRRLDHEKRAAEERGSITIGGGGDGTRGGKTMEGEKRRDLFEGFYGRRPALVTFHRFRPSVA